MEVSSSEQWSAAILSGSEDELTIEESYKHGYLKVLAACILLVAVVLITQLFKIQVVNGQWNLNLAEGNRLHQKIIRAPRGIMYDRNHQLLARNLASFDLVATPNLLPRITNDRQTIYSKIADMISIPASEIKQKAESKGLNFSQPVLITENLDRPKALLLDEKSSSLPGFLLDTNPIREYLDGGMLSHFLGYTGRISADELKTAKDYSPVDLIGKNGLEKYYEDDLKGVSGKEQTEVDANGKPVKLLASKPPTLGNNLILSVDFNLQQKVIEALKNGLEKAGSQRGAAVVMDPNTGQILAAVNYPSYDNNLFAKGISGVSYQKLLNDPNRPLFNRITLGSYPIGSTVKPILSAAGLEEKVITTATAITDSGKIDVPNKYNPSIVYTFKGWKPGGLGVVNIFRALAWSSDIFFYYVGGGYESFRGLGVNRLLNWYAKFGFGKKTGIDIADESPGYLPNPESKNARTGEIWYVGDTYNIAIGQGDLLLTPMQLVNATTVIANGGKLFKPRLVKEITAPDGHVVKKIEPEVIMADMALPSTLDIIRQGMRQAVESGTACCSISKEVPVSVAGKTGTAETSSAGYDGKNPRTKPHAWFTAFAPVDKPQIALVVLIENSGEGAEFAVPVARDILKYYFSPH